MGPQGTRVIRNRRGHIHPSLRDLPLLVDISPLPEVDIVGETILKGMAVVV